MSKPDHLVHLDNTKKSLRNLIEGSAETVCVYVSAQAKLIVAEDTGLKYDAQTEHTVKLVLIKYVITISVIILQEQILIIALEKAIV